MTSPRDQSASIADRPDFDELVFKSVRRHRELGRAGRIATTVGYVAGEYNTWRHPTPQAVTAALMRLERAGRVQRTYAGRWREVVTSCRP